MGKSGKIARMGFQAHEKRKKLEKHAARHGTAAAGGSQPHIQGVSKPLKKAKAAVQHKRKKGKG